MSEGSSATAWSSRPRAAEKSPLPEQQRGQPTVVEAQELLEHQTGQELRRVELLGAVLVPVRKQDVVGGGVGDLQDPARGFARGHISYYVARFSQVRRISTEQDIHLFGLKPIKKRYVPL